MGDAPSELTARRQWVVFRFEDGRKPPYQTRNPQNNASATNPRTWGSLDEAREAVDGGEADGIGYALTVDDRVVFIDLDKCRDPDSEAIEPWAQEILDRFAGCYAEPSVSGTGLHILCQGMLPPGQTGRRRGQIEVYWRDRFMYMTGRPFRGREAIAAPPEGALRWLWEKLGNGADNGAEAHAVAVEVDQSVAAVVALKRKLDAAIENDIEFRYTWSLLRGWLKADGTPDWSTYDLSIASRLVRMDLTDDEIGLAITLFRAEKCQTDEDRLKPTRHRTYLGMTIGKARAGTAPAEGEVSRALSAARRKADKAAETIQEASRTAHAATEAAAEEHRETVRTEAELAGAMEGEREDAFAWIDQQLDVSLKLVRVTRWGVTPGTVSLEFDGHDQPIDFGPAGDLGSPAKFRRTLLHHTERCMRQTKALNSMWPAIVELMLKHAERREAGDSETCTRLGDLITRLLDSSGAPLEKGDTLMRAREEYRVHVHDSYAYVFTRALLRETRFLDIDAHQLWGMLRLLGYEPHVVSTRKSSRQAWRKREEMKKEKD